MAMSGESAAAPALPAATSAANPPMQASLKAGIYQPRAASCCLSHLASRSEP